MKKFFSILLMALLIFTSIQITTALDNSNNSSTLIKETLFVSEPIIKDRDEYITITVEEATSTLTEIGKPTIPVITKVCILPFGSTIEKIDVDFSKEKLIHLQKDILPFTEPPRILTEQTSQPAIIKDDLVYGSKALYPTHQFDYSLNSGLENNTHVMIFTIHCYPLRYSPQQDLLIYSENIELQLNYKKPVNPQVFPDNADLLVIAPEEYATPIQPLLIHKQNHQLQTIFITTEEIYTTYPGRDQAEQIKYCIKNKVEDLGISYVLLIGSIYKLPIRTSVVSLWGRWVEETLTDLYYADLYDSTGNFSTWDTNENNLFGETGEDQLDLYPDVHIGRLACEDINEVELVVDKIIYYEDNTFDQNWFHDMIFIGGNTFRWNPGNEGEELNEMVMDIMSDFNPSSIIWTSKGNFNRQSISRAINEGAGFLYYSGHGFEHGMGTYPPHGPFLKTYLTPYIEDLINGYELPIIFFDACLTAKLDFILQDLLDYKQYRIFDILAKIMNYDTSLRLPCYAWYFIQHDTGGAIATIGATRTAFGGTDSGAGKISLEFFNGYENSETLGQIMTKAQNGYITDVPNDEFTVEEFILLGDPSLKVGGYS